MKKLVIIGFVVVALVLVASILSRKDAISNSNSEKIQVMASFYPVEFLVKSVGGERVEVKTIVPNGVEPHDYEPTTKDLVDIEAAKLTFVNGGLEPWADKISNPVILSTGLMTLEGAEVGVKIPDPHVWTNPLNMIKMTALVADRLSLVDPKNEKYYKDNASQLIAKLDYLDSEMRNQLSRCETRTFVTSHNAFGYLASRYNLEQVEISGLSPEDEPNPGRFAEITKLVRDKKITVIFFESLVSPRLAETIAEETGTTTRVLSPIEGLSDEEIINKDDYLSIQNRNLNELVLAMRCK